MTPFFAQIVSEAGPPQFSVGLTGVSVIVVLLVLMTGPVLLALRNGQRRRDWEHAERMRALEMGLPVPARDAPWAKAAVCLAIGAGVPLIAFGFTYLAYTSRAAGFEEIWVAPPVLSGLSVIGASILAGSLFRAGPGSGDPSGDDGRRGAKPAHDPDALDVVGRRG